MIRRLRRLLFALLLVVVGGLLWLYLEPTPETPPEQRIPITGQIDKIVIEKSARRMTLYQADTPLRSYQVALGFAPDGDKWKQGDGKTPEGEFKIDRRNKYSKFTLSLGLNYPRPADVERAKKGGYDPGGDIFIHGQPNSVPAGFKVKGDWTAGCIAVTNEEMREIWDHTPIGTAVHVRP